MLFNSYIFILCFLPITWLLFILCGRFGQRNISLAFLALASLVFYGYWDIDYIPLILSSVIINYVFGGLILAQPKSKKVLITGILFNIALLCYYKYTNFFIDNLNEISGSEINIRKIALPLGISFFTFQQISYLVDVYSGAIKERNIFIYFAYVLFFPQLISGPIVRYVDVAPQLSNSERIQINYDNLSKGILLFTIGLFKKVILADSIEVYATPIFEAVENGQTIHFIEAWYGAFAYSCQLYFDFSGYSDMAVGLALMFNIHINVNFMSPYKARNLIEFWQRWHISLSVCFQKYLYTPIAMKIRHWPDSILKLAFPFILTMLIIGFWHGAGWNYVVWGGIHGLYLAWNHYFRRKAKHTIFKSKIWFLTSITLTFTAVVAVNVLFRCDSLSHAIDFYRGMFGGNGAIVPYSLQSLFGESDWFHYSYYLFPALHDHYPLSIILQLLLCLAIIFGVKNSNEMIHLFKPSYANLGLAITLFFISFIAMNKVSVFLYYQF